MRRSVWIAGIVALLAACDRPARVPPEQTAAAALKGVPFYPGSSPITVAASADAGQVVLATAAAVQDVATWYRRKLAASGWELRSDAVTSDGSIAIYADSGTRPLWITLKANAGGAGTTYILVGAIPGLDSTAAQRSGSSMSSKRIQRR